MIGYIYITTNLINQKKYIGRHFCTKFDENYYGSGVQLKKALAKYGKENFKIEVLKECESSEELIDLEIYYIKLYNAVESDEFYNHSPGGPLEGWIPGDGNIAKTEYCRKINSEKHRGKKMPQAVKDKQSERQRGKPSGMLGHTQPLAARENISKAAKHQVHTKERDEAVSNHHSGSKMMTNGYEQHWVYKDEIDKKLAEGWWIGSCKKRAPRHKK